MLSVYQLELFDHMSEEDFRFKKERSGEGLKPISAESSDLSGLKLSLEDRLLGECDVPLNYEWIREQLGDTDIPALGISNQVDLTWSQSGLTPEEKQSNGSRV